MITINNVKFGKKGVKDEAGNYTPVHYCLGVLVDGRTVITVYADRCKFLPTSLNAKNNSDAMIDHFEADRVRFFEGSPEFNLLRPLCR